MLGVRGLAGIRDTAKISIEELFMLSEQNNISIRAHNTAADQAKYKADNAKNSLLPSIDASLALSLNSDGLITDRNFANGFAAPIPLLGNNIAVEASQVIFACGAVKNSIKIADLQHQMAVLDAERNRQQVRFLIAANYLELCRLHNHLLVLNSHILQTEQVLESMRAKVKHGIALNSDITRYELQLHNLKYSKIQLENSIFLLNSQIITATGLPHGAIIKTDDAFNINYDSINIENYNQNTAIAVKMAHNAVKIAEHAQKIEQAKHFPVVAAFAGGYVISPIMTEIPVLNKNFNYLAAGISIKYSISNLYKAGNQINAARLALRRASEEKDAAAEQTMLAIEDANTRYHEALALLEVKKKSMQLASENYDLIQQRYDNDLAVITDLLDAAAQKLDAELQTINANINIIYNFYKIKYITSNL
jgi:outer membrane protein TolC